MRLLSNIRPTNTQLKVIAIIVSNADSPVRAAAEVATSQNLIAARNQLMDIGAITLTPSSVELTQVGTQLAKDQGITDETGALTDVGANLINQAPAAQSPVTNEPEVSSELPPLPEGFSTLFKNLLHL